MRLLISSFWLAVSGIIISDAVIDSPRYQVTAIQNRGGYHQSLRFNSYTFTLSAADSVSVRDLSVKAYRGTLLLTNFKTRVDGFLVGAEVADLDKNRFPELYVYSVSDGSGSFGKVYGWQFLLERMAEIKTVNWRNNTEGYMGHDSLWISRDKLCRRFPVYKPGDANAAPTGGFQTLGYRLKSAGQTFLLVADSTSEQSGRH